MEKKDLIKHIINTFDTYLNSKDSELDIISVTEGLREKLRFEYNRFNTSDTVEFVELFSENTIRNLFGDCLEIPDSVMDLTILDKKLRFNKQITSILYENYDYEELQRGIIFSKLMGLVAELSKYSTEKNNYAQKLYNLIRMDFLISNPITTRRAFEKAIDKLLGTVGIKEGKNTYLKDRAKKLFDDFYIKINENTNNLYLCNNCGYLKDKDMSDKFHYFCGDEIVSKFNKKHKEKTKYYVVKSNVYEFYTQPGLIEKEAYKKLVEATFEVVLYPGIEKYGDLEVVIKNKSYFIDAKTTRINPYSLSQELLKPKYRDRIILLPDKKYEDVKDCLLANNSSLKIFNVSELIEYLKKIEKEGDLDE